MAVVAGADFGTLSVHVSVVDSERGLLASSIAEYPLHRKREDPEYATQSHEDHMRALYKAFQPESSAKGIYDKLYAFYSKIYFAFGRPHSAEFGNLLPRLIQLSESAHADAAN